MNPEFEEFSQAINQQNGDKLFQMYCELAGRHDKLLIIVNLLCLERCHGNQAAADNLRNRYLESIANLASSFSN